MKNKWLLFAIALVIFLLKTGAVSALIIGINKLWEKLTGK